MAMMIAIGVVISPILRVEGLCPTAHLINVVCSVFLGPWYSLLCAALIGILRMFFMGVPPLAITGVIFGAFFSGLFYKLSKGNLIFAVLGEIFGTGIIGSIISYPVMSLIWGRTNLTWFFYVPSFIAATIIGGSIAFIVLIQLAKIGQLKKIQNLLGSNTYNYEIKYLKTEKIHNKTKVLVVSAMLIALAMVTSMLKVASLPFGGSVTLFSMLFICLIGYFYGARVGVLAGVAYGILQFVIEPYVFVPVQVLLDYPLAFGALGLSGIFAKSKHGLIKGYILGVFGRYIFHAVSGYVFFKEYVPEGMNDILYTISYNLTYILPELILTVILICIPTINKTISSLKNRLKD